MVQKHSHLHSRQRRDGSVKQRSPQCIQISDFENLRKRSNGQPLARAPDDSKKEHNLSEMTAEQKQTFLKKRQREREEEEKKKKVEAEQP